MSPEIHLLDRDVAARIAAGEVIERPASVVREVIDNSIDAGASRISIILEAGGLSEIRITDNGSGIKSDQIELAFHRHATSKIATSNDLRTIQTLGFRGEALPAIAAAAEVEIISCTTGQSVGVSAHFAGGELLDTAKVPTAEGTTLVVRNLFEHLPARKKFLGSASAEGRQITSLVSHYALAYPGIAFSFKNGRREIHTSGDGALRHAFSSVYGADDGENMLQISLQEGGVDVAGLACPSSMNRANRSGISIFINGRWVQSPRLRFAVAEAYQSQLPRGRFPVVMLKLSIPSEEVDVNVHPAKAEVRLRDEREITSMVFRALQNALDSAPPSPFFLDRSKDMNVNPLLRERLTAEDGKNSVFSQLETKEGLPVQSNRISQRELLPWLRVIGQLATTYILTEGPDALYLLDQHAAHERVRYESLLKSTKSPSSQALFEPVVVNLPAEHLEILDEHKDNFKLLGFDIESFGGNACIVRALPPETGRLDTVTIIHNLFEKLSGEQRLSDPFDRVVASVACHSSVRAGKKLSMSEMERLIEDLHKTDFPRTCPHGRPTLMQIEIEKIERQFLRR